LDAGCRVTGEKYPGTRSSEDLTWWRERSPQAVKDDMSLYGQHAAAGVERYVIAAYGPLMDPTARNHSLPNLCQWWLDAGCRVTGEKYPGTRSSEDLTWWRERSPQAVKDDMSLYGQRAAAGVERYVIAAYGPSAQAEKTAAVPDGGSGPTYRPTYRPTYMQSHW